jgi:hypothetical protein
MHTGSPLLRGVLILVFLAIVNNLLAQNDTVRTGVFQTYWTKQRLVPKLGVSIQERALAEIGIQWHNIYRHPLSLASKGPYATVDFMVDDKNFLLGPKLGYEFTAGVFGSAFDVTYFMDQNYNEEGEDRYAWVATPKVGLTLLGFLNFFYGYQIPISDTTIASLSRHRFSITFNVNRDYFNIKNAPRR